MMEINGIRLYRILPEDFPKFRKFDPLDTLDLAKLPGWFAIGGVEEDRFSGKSECVALMTVSSGEDRLTCEWMAVDPENRGLEIGSAFVDLLFNMAKNMGLTYVAVRFENKIAEGAKAWFREGFFTEEEPCFGIYRVNVSKFVTKADLPKLKKKNYVYSLSDLRPRDKKKAAEYISEAPLRYFSGSGDFAERLYDKELSCVFVKEEKIGGVLLFVSEGNRHYPVLLAADSDREVDDMTAWCADYAEGELPIADELIVSCTNEYTAELMHDLYGERGMVKRDTLLGRVLDYEFL